MSEAARQTGIEVTVTFPLAHKPFHRALDPTATVVEVRNAAMHEFGAVEDPQYSYHLTHHDHLVDHGSTPRELDQHERLADDPRLQAVELRYLQAVHGRILQPASRVAERP